MAKKEKKFNDISFVEVMNDIEYGYFMMHFVHHIKDKKYFGCEYHTRECLTVPSRQEVVDILRYNDIDEFDYFIRFDCDNQDLMQWVPTINKDMYDKFADLDKQEDEWLDKWEEVDIIKAWTNATYVDILSPSKATKKEVE